MVKIMTMRRCNLLLTLTFFQTRSAVVEILKLSTTQKMVFIVVIFTFYTILAPLTVSRAILLMPAATQAGLIAIIFTSYLFFSNRLNRRIIISSQIAYLRQLPIDPEVLLWSHILNLSILNILFVVAYAYLLFRAVAELDISWPTVSFSFFAGSFGIILGQIHYAISSYRGFKSIISSISCILAIIWCFWFFLIKGMNITFFIYTSVVLVVGFLLVRAVIRLYLDPSCSQSCVITDKKLLKSKNPILAMIITDYLALWRRNRQELINRSFLSFLAITYSFIAILNNAHGQAGLVSIFLLIGSSVAFLLLSTLVIKSRKFTLGSHRIRKVLPLSSFDHWFANYLSLFILSIPIVLIYGVIGGWLFGLGLVDNYKIIGLDFLFIALLSATVDMLLNLRLSDKLFVFLQIIVTAFFIVVASISHYIFLLTCFLVHLVSWLVGINWYHRLREDG